jgi:hypothetical protein
MTWNSDFFADATPSLKTMKKYHPYRTLNIHADYMDSDLAEVRQHLYDSVTVKPDH